MLIYIKKKLNATCWYSNTKLKFYIKSYTLVSVRPTQNYTKFKNWINYWSSFYFCWVYL